MMDTHVEELVCDGIECWVGYEKTSYRTMKALLMYCLISGWQINSNKVQYLYINESGKAYLKGELKIYTISTAKGGLKQVSSIP